MAQLEGRSLTFVDAIARALWDGSVKGWNEGDHLARAAEKAGFDLAAMDAAVAADPDRYEAIITANERITPHPAIGACRPSYSRTSRSSARTASSY
jgi:2-hydroxychromene-2-carboxylate isomerase